MLLHSRNTMRELLESHLLTGAQEFALYVHDLLHSFTILRSPESLRKTSCRRISARKRQRMKTTACPNCARRVDFESVRAGGVRTNLPRVCISWFRSKTLFAATAQR